MIGFGQAVEFGVQKVPGAGDRGDTAVIEDLGNNRINPKLSSQGVAFGGRGSGAGRRRSAAIPGRSIK